MTHPQPNFEIAFYFGKNDQAAEGEIKYKRGFSLVLQSPILSSHVLRRRK